MVAIAAIELALALAGVKQMTENRHPFVSMATQRSLYIPATVASSDDWLETAPERQRFFNLQRFRGQKPAGVRRIFCLGGSTTYGHPFDDRTSFCGWLRAFLGEVDPDTHWEVINAGGISYASYRVATLMEELIRYAPDVFVVLTGHNEFLEARSFPAQMLRRSPITRVALSWITSTRSFAAVHDAMHGSSVADGSVSGRMPAEVDALLDHSLGPSAYARETLERDLILEQFRFNLRRIATLAGSAGAVSLWIVPASNVRDCSPFNAQADPKLDPAEGERLDGLMARARTARAAADFADAEKLLEQVLQIDGAHAEAHYRLGQVLHVRGRPGEARRHWIAARDWDVCPLRASSRFEEATRRIARETRARLVDFPALLDAHARRNGLPLAPGAEQFLDHVHPTVELHRELAEAVLAELVDADIARPSVPLDGTIRARVRASIEGSIDTEQSGRALRNLAKVLSWAGKSRDAARIARRAIDTLGGDAESAFVLGVEALERRDYATATRWFEESVTLDPGYAKAHTNLGIALARTGDTARARQHHDLAVARSPRSGTALYNRAALALDQGDVPSALRDYRRLLELDPEDTQSRIQLAFALLRVGDRTAAEREYRRLEDSPHAPSRDSREMRDLERALGDD